MRGQFNITKTKWWLEQGPTLIDQVVAINLEYNKPANDQYKLSRGAFNYHNFFLPQLELQKWRIADTLKYLNCFEILRKKILSIILYV